MKVVVGLTITAALLSALVLAFGAGWRLPGLALVLGVYLGLCVWGSVSLRSGLFCRARWRGATDRNAVALTYDDGPDPRATPALLDLFAERGVRVAFFVVGERVLEQPELLRRAHDEGHLIANHAHRHTRWTNLLPARALRRELEACQAAIAGVIGERPRYYRPPFGLANHALDGVARALSLEVVGWQVRGLDTPGSDPRAVARRVLTRARPGGVVLLHDGGLEPEQVVDTARAVLDGLNERGLAVVRLDELLS